MGERARKHIVERAGAPHAMRRWLELLTEVAGQHADMRLKQYASESTR
jgi:hypothetical protein